MKKNNFELVPNNNMEWNCYLCKKEVDNHDVFLNKKMYLSIGVKDVNESQVEIQYLCIDLPIPICKSCRTMEARYSTYSNIIHLLFYTCCLIYPYFVLSNDLTTFQMVFWHACIAIVSILFGKTILKFIIKSPLKKFIGMEDKDISSYPIISELFNTQWCEKIPSSQILPGMHLAVPYDGDYNKYYNQLVNFLNELAQRHNYSLIVNTLEPQSCKCKKN